ncbi:hypothetical protein BSKO_08409 [Bryopsis sp. KO-2023]|nr:hypothetical protein BSKO_08409 [Bryopsis sp. KO-2023]
MIESLASSAKIVGEGIEVCGSIVYIVDTVLLPAPSLDGIGKRKAVGKRSVEPRPSLPQPPLEVSSQACSDERSILEVLASDPDLKLFVQALEVVGLDEGDIAEAGSEFTVFAPTDEGFMNSLKSMKLSKKKLFSDKKALKSLVEYHIVPENVNGSTISQGSLETLNKKPLFMEVLPTSIEIAGIGSSAQILTLDADESCSSAVHKIDRVLLPFSIAPEQGVPQPPSSPSEQILPSVSDAEPLVIPQPKASPPTPKTTESKQPQRQCRSVAESIASNPDLAILNQAINLAGLSPVLSDKEQSITLFAPIDDAFVQLSAPGAAVKLPILDDPDALGSILSYHALEEPKSFSALKPGGKHRTLVLQDGEPLELTIVENESSPLGIEIEGAEGTASIVKKNIVACGSVIHIIDGVLLPAESSELANAKSGASG